MSYFPPKRESTTICRSLAKHLKQYAATFNIYAGRVVMDIPEEECLNIDELQEIRESVAYVLKNKGLGFTRMLVYPGEGLGIQFTLSKED